MRFGTFENPNNNQERDPNVAVLNEYKDLLEKTKEELEDLRFSSAHRLKEVEWGLNDISREARDTFENIHNLVSVTEKANEILEENPERRDEVKQKLEQLQGLESKMQELNKRQQDLESYKENVLIKISELKKTISDCEEFIDQMIENTTNDEDL